MKAKRKHLVFVNIGDDAPGLLHWQSGVLSSFDVFLYYTGTQSGRYRAWCDFYRVGSESKHQSFISLFRENPDFIKQYEYVCLASHNTMLNAYGFNTLFEIASRQQFLVASPSFDKGSHVKHEHSITQSTVAGFRRVREVESDCPIYQVKLLADVIENEFRFSPLRAPLILEHYSDYLSSMSKVAAGSRIAVIDEVSYRNVIENRS